MSAKWHCLRHAKSRMFCCYFSLLKRQESKKTSRFKIRNNCLVFSRIRVKFVLKFACLEPTKLPLKKYLQKLLKMIQEQSMPKPLRLGESAVTLRTQADSYIPFISDQTYRDRILRRPWVSYRGARPLHRTTLTLDRSKPKLDYLTLYKHVRFFVARQTFFVV